MKKSITIAVLALISLSLFGQEKTYTVSCVAFYNLENIFDTIDSPDTDDAEFTPNGNYKWDSKKYNKKLHNMSYAISQIGGKYAPSGPAILGVAEVENRTVLEDLVKMPLLQKGNYGVVHFDSPDKRGVDVGMLYQKSRFTVSTAIAYPLYIANDSSFRTRDQLLVEGLLDGEKMYVIVNHWPSRMGGEARSRPKRVAAATLTKHIVDSILSIDVNAKIVVMGDLNDDPDNESCKKVLNAKADKAEVTKGNMYNCTWSLYKQGIGSLAYQDKWNLFDQIIISPALIAKDTNGYSFWKVQIMNEDFLIQQEGKYKGYPLRTHAGGSYLNGYSDHFPSLIYLIK